MATITIAVQRSYSQDKQTPAFSVPPPRPKPYKRDHSNYPVVGVAERETMLANLNSEKLAKRQAKNTRHDIPQGRFGMRVVEGQPSEWNLHWFMFMSQLPSDKSDLVVTGTVQTAEAHLSNDQTGIYSEFAVRVEDVLKPDWSVTLDKDAVIVAERPGGRVRFRSGRVQNFSVDDIGMPQAGRRYVMFLKRIDGENDYKLLVGYQLEAGKVRLLDGINTRFGEAYAGIDEANFLNLVRDTVQKDQPQGTDRR